MLFGIDFLKLFSLTFWLEVSPGTLSTKFEIIFLVVLALCYGLFGIFKYRAHLFNERKNFLHGKFFAKVAGYFLSLAVAFTFIFFFRYEGIPLLGGRFWMLIWFLYAVIEGARLIYFWQKELPQKIVEQNARRRFENYLPKKKKK